MPIGRAPAARPIADTVWRHAVAVTVTTTPASNAMAAVTAVLVGTAVAPVEHPLVRERRRRHAPQRPGRPFRPRRLTNVASLPGAVAYGASDTPRGLARLVTRLQRWAKNRWHMLSIA